MLVVWWMTVIDDCSCQTRVIWTKEYGNWPRTIHGDSNQEWWFKLGKKHLVCWDCSDPIQVGTPANNYILEGNEFGSRQNRALKVQMLPGGEAVTMSSFRRVLAHNLLPTFRTPWILPIWDHWDHASNSDKFNDKHPINQFHGKRCDEFIGLKLIEVVSSSWCPFGGAAVGHRF